MTRRAGTVRAMSTARARTAAGLALLALTACTPAPTVTVTPATTTTPSVAASSATPAASASTASASATPSMTPSAVTASPTPRETTRDGRPLLTTAGLGGQRFGTPWTQTSWLAWHDGLGGLDCSRWDVVDAAGSPIGIAPAPEQGSRIEYFQTKWPGLDTPSGIHVGADRSVVLATNPQEVVKNGIQEAYLVQDAAHRMVIDLEPSTGKVALITVVPNDARAPQSYYRMQMLCGG